MMEDKLDCLAFFGMLKTGKGEFAAPPIPIIKIL
jgi:hypothetical protein